MILPLLLVLASAGPASAQVPGRRLVVGSEQDFPPFAVGLTDETANGFTVDLWKEVARESGLTYEIRVRPFHQILQEFKEGKVDVLINLAQSDERREFASFTVPHVTVHGAIFVRKGEGAIHSEADLAGKSILVLKSDLGHDYAIAKGWERQLVQVDTSAEGFEQLAAGRHDAMLLSKLAGLQTLEAMGVSTVIPLAARAGFAQKFSFAVHKDQDQLLANLNESLALAKSSGVYDSLYEKWFGVYEVREPTLREFLKYLVPPSLLALVLLGFLLFRRRAEKRLRESEERFRRIVETAEEGIWTTNAQGLTSFANPKLSRMLGYSATEMVGRPLQDFMDEAGRAAFAQAAVDGPPFPAGQYEAKFLRKDGVEVWTSLVTNPIRDARGAQVGTLAMVTDVTESREAERALRASRQRYAELVSSIEGIVWEADAGGFDFSFVSEQAERLLGHPVERWLEEGFWAAHLHPDDRLWVPQFYRRVAREGRDHELEYRMLAADGRTIWLRDLVTLVSEPGQPRILRGIMMDISARKAAEDERSSLERQMQQTQKLESLGVLAGGIAHDYNNLLTAVMGNISLAMLELPSESPVREQLLEAEAATESAADLARQMLAYSGKGRFVIARVDLAQAVEEMTQMFQVSISKKATLHFDFAPGTPAIEADVTQLRQIILNLVINASDSLGEGSGEIRISTGVRECDRAYLSTTWLQDPLPEGRYAYLEVADTGCGIPEDQLARIFDPFFTTKFTGRGLGLAAVQGIVRGHHGALKVSSALGKGTTFRVLFPPVFEAAEVAVEPDALAEDWRGEGCVLLVDDEESVRKIAAKMLARLGFEVRTAVDGQDAVEVFERDGAAISLVLLDLTMPRMDGQETFRRLRQLRPDIRVVLSSGYSERDVIKRFAGHGLAGFVAKPYTLPTLRAALREATRSA